MLSSSCTYNPHATVTFIYVHVQFLFIFCDSDLVCIDMNCRIPMSTTLLHYNLLHIKCTPTYNLLIIKIIKRS